MRVSIGSSLFMSLHAFFVLFVVLYAKQIKYTPTDNVMKTFSLMGVAMLFLSINIGNTQMSSTHLSSKVIKVEIRKTDSTYELYRDGKPYFIKGAGGSSYPARIASYGGNSIRT